MSTEQAASSGPHRSLLASTFLGPQAENAELMEKLILHVLRDHIFWRRNFQPVDPWVIRESDKSDRRFERRLVRLHQTLNDLLGSLKGDNIPFASPRYIGHMLSDQLLPAIVGYFAAMLYNPNNVTEEVSPETTLLEQKVCGALGRLAGYTPESSWGHLCSGGTIANLEALWVARNAKWLPAGLVLLERDLKESGAGVEFEVDCGRGRTRIGDLSLWELCNFSLEEVVALLDTVRDQVAAALECDGHTAMRLIRGAGISGLGLDRFFLQLRARFPEETAGRESLAGVVIVPSTAHYSLFKVAEVLGLGQGKSAAAWTDPPDAAGSGVVQVPVDARFRMDPQALRRVLESLLDRRIPVIAVATVCGSTEEGAIDPIDEVARLREEFAHRGLYFVHHCDAAFGGYARTLLLDEQSHAIQHPDRIPSRVDWPMDSGVRAQPWPPDGVVPALHSMESADSVTIDPHKLGYVPYPAGAILFRNPDARKLIAFDPAYLDQKVLGSYMLEGSKPGAPAAACWFAIRSLPLHREGHGVLIARSIRNAYTFAESLMALAAEPDSPLSVHVLNYPPDLNMVCFVARRRGTRLLSRMNAEAHHVFRRSFSFDRARALSTHRFILSYTVFSSANGPYPPEVVRHHLERIGIDPASYLESSGRESALEQGLDDRLFVLRATIMNPWLGLSMGAEGEPNHAHTVPPGELTFVSEFLRYLRQAFEDLSGRETEAWEQYLETRRTASRSGHSERG